MIENPDDNEDRRKQMKVVGIWELGVTEGLLIRYQSSSPVSNHPLFL